MGCVKPYFALSLSTAGIATTCAEATIAAGSCGAAATSPLWSIAELDVRPGGRRASAFSGCCVPENAA